MINNKAKSPSHDEGADGRQNRGKYFQKLFFSALAFFLLLAVLFLMVSFYGSSASPTQSEVSLSIPAGSSFLKIKRILAEHHVITDDFRFDLLARFRRNAHRLKAGYYVFPPGLSHNEILTKLATGDIYYQPVTIPEGVNARHVAEILVEAFGFDRGDLLELVYDEVFISSLGLDVSSLEGYLFPDTYYVTKGQTPEAVLSMMVNRFKNVYAEIADDFEGDFLSKRNLSTHQVVILASIVEKETAVAEERPLIAAVFLNRLNKQMKLQADPTVIYGIENFNGNLTRKDLQTPSPYNTYVLNGLPAGPIGNPGRDSIQAVFEPSEVSFLYFVAQNDGTHYFSETLQEHNKAVRLYQKKRGKADLGM